MWPFSRKDVAPQSRKGAAYYFGFGAGRGALTGASYNQFAAEGYAGNIVAFACIGKLAAAVSSVEPQLYKRGKGGKLTKIDAHPLLDLLESPNPSQSGPEFRAWLTAYHQLSGNAFVLGNGMDPFSRAGKAPTELQLLQPGKVKVAPGDGFFPAAFEYRPDGTKLYTYPVEQITGRSAVLQIKTFHPTNSWYGLSPLEPAALPVDIHTGGQKWNLGLLNNGARPSGALVVQAGDGQPGVLSEEQYARLKEQISQQYSGSHNSGRPMLLEGGVDWKEMSVNPKDLDFINGKHSAARDIALAFGVPPQLLGIPGDSTFANYEQAKLAFWTDTVVPLICGYMEALNRWLTPLFGDGLYLWYDEEMIPALEPLRKQKAERINAAAYMTINEKRQAMGLDDVDGGAVILVPSSNVPLELAGQVDLSEPGSATDENDNDGDAAP